jgi:2-polyprenyl-3-methyl-5-hydroxy-6-metoxy-1,4-benzoquinol methylase
MAQRVCPWWLGYFLAGPIRGWLTEDPTELLAPYLRVGNKVLEPGPGMGFFTLPMARMVGSQGRIVAVDIQTRMLEGLGRRAKKAGLDDRIERRLAKSEDLGVEDLAGTIDFVLAFAVVHELPSVEIFFRQVAAAIKPGGSLLLAEPSGHVNQELWNRELQSAQIAGLTFATSPSIRRSRSALFKKM